MFFGQTQTMLDACARLGAHLSQSCLRFPLATLSTSTTQAVISWSSGESESYALVKGTSAGVGVVSMLKHLEVDITEVANSGIPSWRVVLM